jgi:uncharacterized membrane protein YeaQ/YmgE (transglycosylase-associated protein family)
MAFGKDMLDKLKTNKSKAGNELILEQTKGTFIGSAIGLALGLYVGYSRNYSLLFSAFIGATIGGLVTKAFITKKDDN